MPGALIQQSLVTLVGGIEIALVAFRLSQGQLIAQALRIFVAQLLQTRKCMPVVANPRLRQCQALGQSMHIEFVFALRILVIADQGLQVA